MATALFRKQIKPAAATLADLYTVAEGTKAVSSSIIACNTSGTATTFRIAHRLLGASISDVHYLYKDLPIGANDTFKVTGGITFIAEDVLSVYSASGAVTFQVYGQENT